MENHDIELNTPPNTSQEFTQEVIEEQQTPSKDYSEAKKHNRKLFPFYKMFSWDLLFYYSIIFLFLYLEKGWSTSQILLVDSFYPLFKIVVNFPCLAFSDKLRKT